MKIFKKPQILTLFLLLAVAFNAGGLLAKGKPVHGGNSNQEPRAVFLFPDQTSSLLLTGDGEGDPDVGINNYADSPGGVEAYFMGSGNPKLELGDPLRKLIITLEDTPNTTCTVAGETFYANGNALWFSGLTDSTGQTIDDRFLGMAQPQVGDSRMILRFLDVDEDTGKEYAWRLIFDEYDSDGSRVAVERTVDGRWLVYGLEPGLFATARATRANTKGKSVVDVDTFCSTSINFEIQEVTP